MKQTTYEQHNQIDLIEAIQEQGINLVNCGSCGAIQLIKTDSEEVECYYCGLIGEQSDYPDFFHRGMTLTTDKENQ